MFGVLSQGLRSHGKAVFVTMVLPLIGLFALCTKMLTMVNSSSLQVCKHFFILFLTQIHNIFLEFVSVNRLARFFPKHTELDIGWTRGVFNVGFAGRIGDVNFQ